MAESFGEKDGVEPASIPLRRTPPTRRLGAMLLMIVLGGLPGVALPLAWFTVTKAIPFELAIVGFIAVFIGALGWLARLFVLPKPTAVLILSASAAAPAPRGPPRAADADGVDDAALVFPFGRGQVRLALDELAVCRADGRDLVLLAVPQPGQASKADAGSFIVPARCFTNKTGAVDVVGAVRACMARSPFGPGLLARLDENEARQKAFARRRPLVTWGITAVCLLVFGIEVAVNALADPHALVVLGANAPALVARGEVWRLVTACLLHGSMIHVLMNISGLVTTGALLERWMGRAGFAVVVVVCGVLAQAGSAVAARAPMSVGFSGASFGLLGVLLASTILFRGQAVGGVKVPLSSWIFLLATNGALALLPFVDVVAHGTGFVAGVGCGFLLAPRPGKPPLLKARARSVAAGVAAVVVVAAIVCALLSALDPANGLIAV
ncbi:MAG: rhomboid family intramembrane serine protease [Deltaproteobacteria bacterium]|nr:rhomboid family intramembrane serine protease [Deltaproteobacteria bacterium]